MNTTPLGVTYWRGHVAIAWQCEIDSKMADLLKENFSFFLDSLCENGSTLIVSPGDVLKTRPMENEGYKRLVIRCKNEGCVRVFDLDVFFYAKRVRVERNGFLMSEFIASIPTYAQYLNCQPLKRRCAKCVEEFNGLSRCILQNNPGNFKDDNDDHETV